MALAAHLTINDEILKQPLAQIWARHFEVLSSDKSPSVDLISPDRFMSLGTGTLLVREPLPAQTVDATLT
jgi:hypothetical protein